jgi:DNA-binding transcriptional MerR regulator
MRFVTDAQPVLGLTVAAVARRLGVAPATLRTWERRYGLGPTERVAGSRRRYTPADLDVLERMRRMTLNGVAPVDAARAALAGAPPPVAPGRVLDPTGGHEALLEADDRTGRPGGPGGRVVPMPRGDARSRGLARAVLALDDRAAREILVESLQLHGVVETWERLLVPVLRAVGDRWGGTGEGVEVEHLLSESARFALLRAGDAAPEPEPVRPALLACAEDEGHCLALYALAAALAERRVPARVLGGLLPAEALVAAVRRTGPSSVFVWSQLPDTGDTAFVGDLPTTRPPTAVLLGGPGWDTHMVPAGATVAHDLGEAVHLVELAAGMG